MNTAHELTRAQTHTSFSKWNHDVSCSIKEAGKSQRGHITPHLESSGKGVINQRVIHVWSIVNDPEEKRRTTLFQTYNWQCKWRNLLLHQRRTLYLAPCITKHTRYNIASSLLTDYFYLLTYKWHHDCPIWDLRQTFCSWPHREPRSEAVSWPPGWTCPSLQSPPTPSASASSSKPWRWTPSTGSRCVAVSSCSQTSSGNPGRRKRETTIMSPYCVYVLWWAG